MKSFDSSHDHDHDHDHDRSIDIDSPARLPRRIARKAAGGGGDQQATSSPLAGVQTFSAAVNAGIHGPILRRAGAGELAPDAGSLVATAASSSGSPLPSTLQRKFEDSLGADLSSVRVHTGDASAQASAAVSARAYTTGQDVHFAAGQYDPSSAAGEHLLAHEVAHTVQQAGAPSTTQYKLEVSAPGDACEVEADAAADAMVSGRSFQVSGAGGVQRKIMRTGEDETTGTTGTTGDAPARDDAPGTGETGTGTGTGETGTGTGETAGGGPTAPETVETVWSVDYDRVYRGPNASGVRPPGERSDTTGIQIHTMVVQPSLGDVTPNTPFSGYHLRDAGNVRLGTRQHPRGQGGTVSASISYIQDGDIVISATGGANARERRAAVRDVREALSRSTELVPADASALANSLLTEAQRNAGITITANTGAGRHVHTNPDPLHYGPITERRGMNVVIEVPRGGRRVIGDDAAGGSTTTTTGTTSGATDGTTAETEMTTEARTELLTEVQRGYESAVTEVSRTLTEQILRGSIDLHDTFEFGGTATAGVSSTIGGNFSIGDVLALLAPEIAAFVEGMGPSINIGVTPNLGLEVSATNSTTGGFELGAEQRTTAERSIERALTQTMNARWSSTFSTALISTIRRGTSSERSTGASAGTTTETHRSSTRRSEGDAVSQLDVPRLVLAGPRS